MQVSQLYGATSGSKIVEASKLFETPAIKINNRDIDRLLDIIAVIRKLGYAPHLDSIGAILTKTGLRFMIHDFDNFVPKPSYIGDYLPYLGDSPAPLVFWAEHLKLTYAGLYEELRKRST